MSEEARHHHLSSSRLRPVMNGGRPAREPLGVMGPAPVEPAWPHLDRRASRLLYDEGGYLLTRHDEQGAIISASPAVELLLGHAPGQIAGFYWHDFVHPADLPVFKTWWSSIGHGSSFTHAYRLQALDGKVLSVETLARKVDVGPAGAFEIHALSRDVSFEVERIEDLARERGQLERRIDILARHDQAATRFAAAAAHDLRAPLQAITGFAQLLSRREGAELDETSQRFLAMIMSAAGDMADLLNSALEHGQATWAESRLEAVDCTAVVERALLHLDAEITRTGATVEVGDLPTVHAEPTQLLRVFQNLIANACKSTHASRPVHVGVSADRVGEAWQFSVTDDGAGVPPEDRERIFDLLKHGRQSGDGRAGIGLAICRTIVERHGGRLWVEDAPGGGSRFSFFIPDSDTGPTDHTA